MQMVSLLKDPRGQTIFSAHEEALQSTPPLGRLINNDLLNTKRRMKQLEDAIVEYRVSILASGAQNNTIQKP